MEPIDSFLLNTLTLAQSSQSKGNHPFGAVLVHEGRVIADAENTVNSDRDVTAHAEMNLIRKAVRCFPKPISEIVKGSLQIPCKDVLMHGQKEFRIFGPIAETRFREIHDLFWHRLTAFSERYGIPKSHP